MDAQRLIDANALLKKIAHHTVNDSLKYITFESANTYEQVKGDMFSLVQKAHTVDAVPVVHGRWIYGITLNHEWRKCSECLVSQEIFGCFTYCPNCGAKMDGGAEE